MEAQRERGRDLMLRLAVRKRIDQSTVAQREEWVNKNIVMEVNNSLVI